MENDGLQYYTIITESDDFTTEPNLNEEESQNVMYLTFAKEDAEEKIHNQFKIEHAELSDAPGTSNIEFINIEVDTEDLLLSSDENNVQQNNDYLDEEITIKSVDFANTKIELEPTENEYKEILLEDGTCAIIDHELWKSLLENVNKSAATSKKERKYPCMYAGCDKVYTAPHHLTVHIRSHTGNRPFSCEICEKSFVTGYSLKAHMRTHSGEKPYGCCVCKKRFKTSGDLQKHIRIHTGEKPFICPIEGCGKSFTTSNIRKVHIRSHTGERPYVCDYPDCGKAFPSATNYKNHMRIHSGEKPYVCSVEGCNKRFTEYSSLYKHNAVHQSGKPYKCNYCNSYCKHESTLKSHKRYMHNVVIANSGTEIIINKNKCSTILI